MAKEQDGDSLVFDVNRIRQLIELMNQHELNEIDLRHSDRRIRLRRGAEIAQVVSVPAAAQLPVAPPPTPSPPSTPATAPAQTKAAETPPPVDESVVMIKSPMVGTFYSRPKPDAPPYVKVGDTVQADTTVCVIEAMKTFNELPAGIAGKIVAVLVKDDEPVDVNKPLFKIVPS